MNIVLPSKIINVDLDGFGQVSIHNNAKTKAAINSLHQFSNNMYTAENSNAIKKALKEAMAVSVDSSHLGKLTEFFLDDDDQRFHFLVAVGVILAAETKKFTDKILKDSGN